MNEITGSIDIRKSQRANVRETMRTGPRDRVGLVSWQTRSSAMISSITFYRTNRIITAPDGQ